MNNSLVLTVVVGLFSAAGGFLAGRAGDRAKEGGDPMATQTASRGISGTRSGNADKAVQPNLRGYELSRNPRMGLETLLLELKETPMATMDFEAMFAVWDMVQYLNASELEEMLGDLKELGSGQEAMIVEMMMLNRWAAKDGRSAMEYITENTQAMSRSVSSMGAMMGWMRSSPETAYQWFQENSDSFSGGMGMSKEQIEGMYYSSLAKTDFEGAMAKLDSLDENTKSSVVGQMAGTFALDPLKRKQLLDKLEAGGDDDLLSGARTAIVSQMVFSEPLTAVSFIEAEVSDSAEQEELIDNMTLTWSHNDPAAAVTWQGGRLSGSEDAGPKIANNFGNWIRQDEAAAAEWLEARGDEFKTDEVFREASRSLRYTQNTDAYERSAAWAGQIFDEAERNQAQSEIYMGWSGKDQEAADQWKASLPESDRLAMEPEATADD